MNDTLNCVILHQKCRFLIKEKRCILLKYSVLTNLSFSLSGATGNRTRDTRIFSPLLYQLSYGTSLLCCFGFQSECKGNHFFQLCKGLMQFFSFFYSPSGGKWGSGSDFSRGIGVWNADVVRRGRTPPTPLGEPFAPRSPICYCSAVGWRIVSRACKLQARKHISPIWANPLIS